VIGHVVTPGDDFVAADEDAADRDLADVNRLFGLPNVMRCRNVPSWLDERKTSTSASPIQNSSLRTICTTGLG
jgi:hypothetical protein